MGAWLPQEIIRRKRDGAVLSAQEIRAFIEGVTQSSVSDAQIAALAMAVCWRGMSADECVALTLAMRDSGRVLDWREASLPGPVVDKHSTGGVGDTVSLVLAPMLAACGAFVPMISGRGLGHTGGTLDKLESIPGYSSTPPIALLRRVVCEAGVAIIGQTDELAPADRRLYAVRDMTATVESIPLIVASILSKKLAAGLDALVMDVKFGSGAFMRGFDQAQRLAERLVEVGSGAGLPTVALLTDMDQPLAPCAGNAIEVRAALDYLAGRARPARLDEVTRALGSTLLLQVRLAVTEDEARCRLDEALRSGQAAERFARMVKGLGGPGDLFERTDHYLERAPIVRAVPVPERVRVPNHRRIARIDTRALGLAVLELGGGRRRAEDRIDHAVGLSELAPLGAVLDPGAHLGLVHARSEQAARTAIAAVQAAYTLSDTTQLVGAPSAIAGRVTPAHLTGKGS